MLTSVEIKREGESKHGKWVLRLFKDAGGNKYQTFDVDLGEKASGLIGRSVEVRFEVEQNGDYENKVLKAVRETENPQASGSTPEAQQSLSVAPVVSQAPSSDRPIRSHETNRSDALGQAIGTSFVNAKTVEELIAVADYYLRYIEGGSQSLVTPAAEPVEDDIKF